MFSQNIKDFKMPLFLDLYSVGSCLIPSLLPQKYSSFQNTSLVGFIFGGGRLILSLLPQKYSSFQNASLLGFIFGGGHLILFLLP